MPILTVEDCVVCGEAADALDAIAAARRLKPHLILIDLSMPGMSGMDAARDICEESPSLSIMLMTDPDPEIVAAARRFGIRGTVSKVGNILSGVRAVLPGRRVLLSGSAASYRAAGSRSIRNVSTAAALRARLERPAALPWRM